METQRHRQPQLQHIAFQGITISQGVSPIPFVFPGISGRENMAAGVATVIGEAWVPCLVQESTSGLLLGKHSGPN